MAKKILIIDDDKDLADNIAKVLANKGYNVTQAYNGAEGLKKAVSIKPDLIIMDVMMETDTAGFEIADQIRSKREFSKYKDIKYTPIIILTSINQFTNSRFSMDDKNNFLPEINGFLTKPVNIDILLEKVKEIL
jgi:CheY-like chemotaxis protein